MFNFTNQTDSHVFPLITTFYLIYQGQGWIFVDRLPVLDVLYKINVCIYIVYNIYGICIGEASALLLWYWYRQKEKITYTGEYRDAGSNIWHKCNGLFQWQFCCHGDIRSKVKFLKGKSSNNLQYFGALGLRYENGWQRDMVTQK